MNSHTARARDVAYRDYLAFVNRNKTDDFAAWVRNMQFRGLAVNTIRQRVSLVCPLLGIQNDISLPSRRNLHEGKWLNAEQLQALLAAIPNNEDKRRDFALITAFLITGLRIENIRTWRWKDLKQDGGKCKADRIPKMVFDVLCAIQLPRKNTHFNPEPMFHSDEDFIFTTFHCRDSISERRHAVRSSSLCQRPISPQEINRRIKRYARLAGLETEGINSEALRRTQKKLGLDIIIHLLQESFSKRRSSPVRWKRLERDPRLHGLGRRGRGR